MQYLTCNIWVTKKRILKLSYEEIILFVIIEFVMLDKSRIFIPASDLLILDACLSM